MLGDRLRHQRTGHHQRFFIRQQQLFTRARRRHGGQQTRRANNRRHHSGDFGGTGHVAQRLHTDQNLGCTSGFIGHRLQTRPHILRHRLIQNNGIFRLKLHALFDQQFRLSITRQCKYLKLLGMTRNHVQG